LFASSKANISEHIKHIYKSGELDKKATVRNFRTADNALVALTLMIAESKPDEKDIMAQVVVNLINGYNF